MTDLVKVTNLRKSYGSKEAVKGISFNIKENEILGLLGPNGSGKTTTIGMLLGLLKPSEGEIVAVGPGALNSDGKRNPIDVKVGDKVLFSKYSGDEVKLDGQDLIIIKEEDVIGVLN